MSHVAVGQAVGSVRALHTTADPRSAACVLGCGPIVALGFLDGGYYASTWRWASLALVAVAGLQIVLGRADRLTVPGLVALATLGGFAGWMLLSAVWGVEGTEALREAERAGLYVAGLGAFLAACSRAEARALLVGALAGIVAVAGFGVGQRIIAPPPLDPYQGALLREPVGYANSLGVLAAMGVVLALGLALECDSRWRRCALVASAAISATALILTSSRGAWLALLVGLAVLGIGRMRSARVVAASAVVGVLLVVVTVAHAPLGDRPAYWGVAVAATADRPLLGSGAGSFDDIWLEERPIAAFVRDAHNLYLETASELGLVGLALLLAALGAPLVAAARGSRSPIVVTAAAAYMVFLVHAGLDWDWEMPVTVVAGLACGAALLMGADRDE